MEIVVDPVLRLIHLDRLRDSIMQLQRRAGEYDDFGRGYNAGIERAADLVDEIIALKG